MSHHVKYPRTPHLPTSLSVTSDDKIIARGALDELFDGRELVVTEKMDGGNMTFYRDSIHARSTSSTIGPWEDRAKAIWAQMRHDIPEGWRVCGESLWAERSVAYSSLPGYFMVFSIWDEHNVSLPWSVVEEWAALLELPTVPVLYRGTNGEAALQAWAREHTTEESEGFVVRAADAIPYEDFERRMAKWVRSNHVRTASDWRHRDDFKRNGLSS